MPIPSSTYRLQVQRDFTLYEAAALTGYLADLGVGAVYLSPLLQSTIGSDHGYDTTDVTRLDRDRGGEEGLRELLTAARAAGLGVVIDIVPNHLGISAPSENPAWWDVLRRGQDSEYARWFDIDWSRGRIVVPILGDDPTLRIQDGELRYFEHRFPLAPGSWEQGDDPEAVHGRQHYELVHHSRGNAELNYRRFFAITTLAGVRQEDPAVFDATHSQVQRWIDAGIDGLRIDHPDGLVDPAGYLVRLRSIAPNAWITVEKILETGEELPADWPVSGTTGYDAMREVNGVFVDPAQAAVFTDLYQRLSGDRRTLGEHVEAAKRMVVTNYCPQRFGGCPRWCRTSRRRTPPLLKWPWPSRSTGRICRKVPSISTAPSSEPRSVDLSSSRRLINLVPGCMILATSWRDACNSSPAPRWRRALRTRPTTDTRGSWP